MALLAVPTHLRTIGLDFGSRLSAYCSLDEVAEEGAAAMEPRPWRSSSPSRYRGPVSWKRAARRGGCRARGEHRRPSRAVHITRIYTKIRPQRCLQLADLARVRGRLLSPGGLRSDKSNCGRMHPPVRGTADRNLHESD